MQWLRNGLLLACAVLATQAGATHFEIYGGRSVGELGFLREIGIDQIVLEDFSLAHQAESLGFSLVLPNWWSSQTRWDAISRRLDEARGVPCLASLNMMDEPDRNGVDLHPPALYQGLRQRIQQSGFQGSLSLTIYGPKDSWTASEVAQFREYVKAVDVLRIDPYPVAAKAPLSQVHRWTVHARELMRETLGHEIPLVVILQTWTGDDDANGNPKLPSIVQLRVMAYEALLMRVETLSFFDFNADVWAKVPGFVDGFRSLMQELGSLRDRLDTASMTTTMESDVLTAMVKGSNGESLVIKVNTADHEVGDLGPYEVRY